MFRLLSLHIVLSASEDVEVSDLLSTEAVLRQHTFNYAANEFVRTLLHQVSRSKLALATRETGVANINAVIPFVAGQLYFVSVDDDHVVTTINVRSVRRFVLAAEQLSYLRTHATKDLVLSVNNNPLFLSGSLVG